jgi:threonine synthase
MQRRLAMEEGIFCEPAGAVAVAGAARALERGEVAAESVIVCIITGVGFKDVPSVERMIAQCSCPTIDYSEL